MNKFLLMWILATSLLATPNNSKAGIGVISLLGGPGGYPIIAFAGKTMGYSALGFYGCGIVYRIRNHRWPTADDFDLCQFITILPIGVGLIILDAGDSEHEGLIKELMMSYGADQDSAANIADRLYNKALAASYENQKLGKEVSGHLVVESEISLSQDELTDLSSSDFIGTAGFQKMVKNFE